MPLAPHKHKAGVASSPPPKTGLIRLREGLDRCRIRKVNADLTLSVLLAGELNTPISSNLHLGRQDTKLNRLSAAIPGGERVVSVEEVFQLRFPRSNVDTRYPGLAA